MHVLVVDDSAVVRREIVRILQGVADIDSVDAAADPLFALKKLETRWPDVIILDLEMPRMDGLTFLREIMDMRPTPVIICSSLATEGASLSLAAMDAGAMAIITKPGLGIKDFIDESREQFIHQVRLAATYSLRRPDSTSGLEKNPSSQTSRASHEKDGRKGNTGLFAHWQRRKDSTNRGTDGHQASHGSIDNHPAYQAGPAAPLHGKETHGLVAIGTSTGGTMAVETILSSLSLDSPPIVIVQHMPEHFTRAFAERLNANSQLEVLEGKDGMEARPGRAIIAPGNYHMQITRSGARYIVDIKSGPMVKRHRPSVDVLFRSVAEQVGPSALGILLTGMGDDGARGLKAMRDAGARTIAQNEESCVVFGMPREAIEIGAAQQVLPLNGMAGAISAFPHQMAGPGASVVK